MRRVLAAARGLVALRVIAACRRRGWFPVAVAARSDQQCRPVVAAADECAELDGRTAAETYDSVDAIVAAAARHRVDLVHPGCGALAENPELPRRLAALGVGLVGPSADALEVAGDKGRTVTAAARLGIPVLPHATTRAEFDDLLDRVGLPLVVKPARGCLGAGVRVVRDRADLEPALVAHGAGGWYAERFVDRGTVVAVTVAVDAGGHPVELGERETLLLAGSFKLLDAAPVLTVPPPALARMREDAGRLVTGLGLVGVATCEFIVGPAGYFLLEVNPRLAGGYRMCEAQTGRDVVSLQLSIADGRSIGGVPVAVDRERHCLEARWYLRPEATRTGMFARLRLATMPGVTYDCVIEEGRTMVFDRIVAQLLAIAPDRPAAAGRLLQAGEAADVQGPPHHGDDIAGWLREAGPAPWPRALVGS